ncbi:8371_t:CDS:2, partial [Acaulospora morrowiae]
AQLKFFDLSNPPSQMLVKGNARLAGLEKDLGLSNGQYQIALAVFFIGEVVMKIPSNVILHRFAPSKWISLIIFFWSIVTCFTATIQNFEDLIVTRVFLGITEAGLTPGIMYLLSMWYSPKKLATRFAIYYSGGVSAGAFGGLLAYAITGNLHGVAGLQGWRWLSIIEGFCGFIIALIAYFTLPDFPATSKFLTDQERIFLMSQLGDCPSSTKQCKSTKEFVRDGVIPTFKDWKVYYAMLIKAACGVAMNSIILFLPTLVHSMGFEVLNSQLMTAPPYLVAVFFSLSVALHSDKVGERPFHIVGPALVAILGFVLMGVSSSPGISYFATFLCSSGVWTIPPVVLTWIADIFSFSYEKRLVAHTVVLALANLS